MPTSPRSKTVLFQIDFGEIVTFYKGPMWASAPTDTFFDNLSAVNLTALLRIYFIFRTSWSFSP